MEQLLESIVSLDISQIIAKGGILAARLVPAIVFVPFLAGRPIPPPVKAGISVIMLIVAFPHVNYLPSNPLDYIGIFFHELAIGFAYGFTVRLSVEALLIAGKFVDTVSGTGFVNVMVPQIEERVSPLSAFYFYIYIIVFFGAGFHLAYIEEIIGSYNIVPCYELNNISVQKTVERIAFVFFSSFKLCVAVASPAVIAGVLSEVCMGVVGKASPQINAFIIGMPLRISAGIFLTLLSLPVAIKLLNIHAQEIMGVLRALFTSGN